MTRKATASKVTTAEAADPKGAPAGRLALAEGESKPAHTGDRGADHQAEHTDAATKEEAERGGREKDVGHDRWPLSAGDRPCRTVLLQPVEAAISEPLRMVPRSVLGLLECRGTYIPQLCAGHVVAIYTNRKKSRNDHLRPDSGWG